MDAQSMAIVMAASSSVSTPGVVNELMAENRRLRQLNDAAIVALEDALAAGAQRDAERNAELQHRDDVIVALHDAHVAELQIRDEAIVALHDAHAAQNRAARRAASDAMEAWRELED